MKYLPTLLTILFVGLKLTGHISWSWWLVLAPAFVSLGFGLALIVLLIIAHLR